jgi:hypothetical protein
MDLASSAFDNGKAYKDKPNITGTWKTILLIAFLLTIRRALLEVAPEKIEATMAGIVNYHPPKRGSLNNGLKRVSKILTTHLSRIAGFAALIRGTGATE